MILLVDAQTVGVLVTATSVTIAAIYYVLNIRISQRNQELMLKSQETSVKTQELALKSQQQNLETRKVQLFMSVYQRFEEPDFQNAFWEQMSWQIKDYDDYVAKYGEKANPEAWRKYAMVSTFFEGLGVLVKRGFIDAAIVDDLMSMYIIGYWQKYESINIGLRKSMNTPTAAEYFEYLYGVVYGIWRQQHPGYENVTLSQ